MAGNIKVVVCKDADEVARKCAGMFVEQVRNKPTSVLGFATGSTPMEIELAVHRVHAFTEPPNFARIDGNSSSFEALAVVDGLEPQPFGDEGAELGSRGGVGVGFWCGARVGFFDAARGSRDAARLVLKRADAGHVDGERLGIDKLIRRALGLVRFSALRLLGVFVGLGGMVLGRWGGLLRVGFRSAFGGPAGSVFCLGFAGFQRGEGPKEPVGRGALGGATLRVRSLCCLCFGPPRHRREHPSTWPGAQTWRFECP